MILVGFWPRVATAASPCLTVTEPCGLASSTVPSMTMRAVLSPVTVSDQSVPRMAAAAAGVSIVRLPPPRAARAQTVPFRQGERRRPALSHVLDHQRRVAADTDLRLIGEEQSERADRIGAQRVAAEQILPDLRRHPGRIADRLELLAALGRHDQARMRRRASQRIRPRQGRAADQGARANCEEDNSFHPRLTPISRARNFRQGGGDGKSEAGAPLT